MWIKNKSRNLTAAAFADPFSGPSGHKFPWQIASDLPGGSG
jgi:hypothetical protein